MFRTSVVASVFALSSLAFSNFGYAQFVNPVGSDASGNTAMGSGVLVSITAGAQYNTGAGDHALQSDTSGSLNTAFGYGALGDNNTGSYNTAMGVTALVANTTGTYNAAFGYSTLWSNTVGSENTALGHDVLEDNTTGSHNTGSGTWALQTNTTGTDNTANGYAALILSTTASFNTASGSSALSSNTTGASNTASGYDSMYSNVSGANNTAFGADALFSNTTGKGNAAQGVNALYSNTTGIRNLGIGSNALYDNVSGSYNLALGFDAGYNQTTGNDNIYFNNAGVAGESQTLRLGAQGTAGVLGSGILSAYIAGVATSQVTGSAVYVNSSGKLGVLASSERFKTDVESMQTASEKLAQLRPVTFKLKTDPDGIVQYGLIAEEVAKVYPELVIHGANGRIDGVRYEELAPMLLNEMQQQQQAIAAQDAEIRDLKQQVADLNNLKQDLHAALVRLQTKDELVAQTVKETK